MALTGPKPLKAKLTLNLDLSECEEVTNEERVSTSHLPRVLTTRNRNLPVDFPTSTPKARPSLSSLKRSLGQLLWAKDEMQSERLKAAKEDHWRLTLQSLILSNQTPQPDLISIRDRAVSLPSLFPTRKTLIFDLDETLVHCDSQQGQVTLPISLPAGESGTVGVNIRPFARECLQRAAELYEVVVFTASQRHYADSVIDYLDPEGRLVHHRLYRESCMQGPKGHYIKDLRILAGRKLQDIVIVDNTVYSFCYQLDNGVPILSWQDDPDDTELLRLRDYLSHLSDVPDIRVINRATFQLYRLSRDCLRFTRNGKENSP